MTVIYKQLATKQDMALGTGKVTQNRNGQDVELDMIDFMGQNEGGLYFPRKYSTIALAVASEALNLDDTIFVDGTTNVKGLTEGTIWDVIDATLVAINGITSYAVTSNTDLALVQRLSNDVSIKDFDVQAGTYGYIIPKNTLEFADTLCFENGKTLYFPDGQYCINYTFEKKARWFHNGTCPKLAPFPLQDDDKIYLRPGYKDKLPGAAIIAMTGVYTSHTNSRTDFLNDLKPVIVIAPGAPGAMGGIAIVMDMDVFDVNGDLTTTATDNRATGMDTGLLIQDSAAGDYPNLVIFGYYDKVGLAIGSFGTGGDNPDYNKFGFGTTMGYIGLAILGNNTAAGDGPGLSGSQFLGFQLFANDHHNIARLPQSLKTWQTNGYGHLLKIDGKTSAIKADINGHEFVAGGWRTYSKDPVLLDNCTNLHTLSVPMEFSDIATQPDAATAVFQATENTKDIHLMHSRNLTFLQYAHANFGDVIEKFMVTSQIYGDLMIGNKGEYIKLSGTSSGDVPRIQFTNEPSTTAGGVTFKRDPADSMAFYIEQEGVNIARVDPTSNAFTTYVQETFKNYPNSVSATIASGVVTNVLDRSRIIVIGQANTTDNLDTINSATPPVAGQTITFVQGLQASVITFRHGVGNIRFADGVDRVLDNAFKQLTLVWSGAYWVEFA